MDKSDKIDRFLDVLELAETQKDKYDLAMKFTFVAFTAGRDSVRKKKTGYNLMHRMLNMLKGKYK